MTIRDVLAADWTVGEIDVKVYIANELQEEYMIGADVEPNRYMRFVHETQAGDVYLDIGSKQKRMLIKRNIRARHCEEKKKGEEMCEGVLLNEIPKELLELEVSAMFPSDLWGSDGAHRYTFYAQPLLAWGGVKGEDVVIEHEQEG